MSQTSFKNSCLFTVFFVLAFCIKVDAQLIKGKDNRLEASQHIRDLEGGTLIVRLTSKHKNIQAIDELLKKDGLSAKDRKSLNKRRNKMLAKQLKSSKAIHDAFNEHYTFSKYLFFYDTAMVHLLAGQDRGFFLNKSLEIDSAIAVNLYAPIYMLSLGQTDVAETHNVEGFIISDIENKELPKPFPYFIKSHYSRDSFLYAFIGRSDYNIPNFKRMTVKLNNRLTNYYKEVLFNIKNRELKEELNLD